MRLLYGDRSEHLGVVAAAIGRDADVVDLCCGDCALAPFVLAHGCTYRGYDVNRTFVEHGRRLGLETYVLDVRAEDLPAGDVLSLVGSLYQFIPDDRRLVDRMLHSAKHAVVVSEPVVNWQSSKLPVARSLAQRLTRVDGRAFPYRHTEQTLRDLLAGLPKDAVALRRAGRDLVIAIDSARAGS